MNKVMLIIDDDANLAALIARVGHRYLPDMRMLIAKTGGEGLEKARAVQPRAVMLDIVLPDKDGFEVCRQLRADPLTKNASIMMMSGSVREPSQIVMSEKCGADDYVIKPFTIADLVSRLKNLLRRPSIYADNVAISPTLEIIHTAYSSRGGTDCISTR